MNQALHYRDIALIPRYSKLTTRKDADISVDFLGRSFRLPVVPSNMKCTIDEKHSKWLSENGYFYVMHRFDMSVYDFVVKANAEQWKTISISVGVGEADKALILKLWKEHHRVDFITIDIAHGHSILMKGMLEYIRSMTDQRWNPKIIAGNIATVSGFRALVDWGADAVKALIGTGGVCSTKNKTGFTVPAYSCIKDIDIWRHEEYRPNELYQAIPLIADGGVRENGDIAKAIHAGADMVMSGALFSKLVDSPSETVNGHKVYFGSASQFNKGEYRNVEGIKRVLDIEYMTYEDKLIEIEQDLQSSVSYAGGESLFDIRKADVIRVTTWETQV